MEYLNQLKSEYIYLQASFRRSPSAELHNQIAETYSLIKRQMILIQGEV